MKDRTLDIVGSLTGIVFVVLLVLSFGSRGSLRDDLDVSNVSMTSVSAAQAANVLVDRRDEVRSSSFIGLFGLAFFLGSWRIFAAGFSGPRAKAAG